MTVRDEGGAFLSGGIVEIFCLISMPWITEPFYKCTVSYFTTFAEQKAEPSKILKKKKSKFFIPPLITAAS